MNDLLLLNSNSQDTNHVLRFSAGLQQIVYIMDHLLLLNSNSQDTNQV